MPDEVTTPSPVATPEAQAAPETFSLTYVKELREEAAAARISKKEAVEAARATADKEWQAKYDSAESEFTALQSDSLGKDVTIAKLMAAISAGVPTDKITDFVEILKGDTAEEIAVSTEKALTLFGGLNISDRPTDPSQGSGGGAPHALNSNALLNSLKAAVGAN